MRSLVKYLLAVVLLVPAGASAQESATVSAERVTVRATPANDGKVVMTLTRGTGVTVVERRDAWSKVSARSRSGWVRTNSLTVLAGKSAPAASASAQQQRRSEPRRSTASRSTAGRRGPLGAIRAGDNVLGPAVGLGGVNGTLAVGGELEHGIKTLPELGNGALAISAQAFYYHYTFIGITNATITMIPVGAAANYHFALKDQRVDPFVGLGLGYAFARANVSGFSAYSTSGLFFWGRVGARYFVTPKLAVHADAGLGMANLNVGLMFRP